MELNDINMAIKMGSSSFAGIWDLDCGRTVEESQIENLCAYVDARYDCADFRAIVLIKTFLAYREFLSDSISARIKTCLLGFKYWMDEPGEDSICYWSENHQLLFHTCEYLAGEAFPTETFANNGMSGREHQAKAEKKLLQWLEDKWTYGFIEWHSNTYYEEDIAPLVVLVDHAGDPAIATKAATILDLLLLDLAMYSQDGFFSTSSGRCYENQKKDGTKQDTLDIYRSAFVPEFKDFNFERLSALFVLRKKYRVPEVFARIARDKNPGVLKDSMGLSLKEVRRELGTRSLESAGAFLWQMEAFTNVESVELTMRMFNRYHLQSNVFLGDLKMINHPLLRKMGLLPFLVKVLNPSTQGVAIQRSNNYTFKTERFMLSTAMRYHPGEFGDQQHIWHAVLPENIQVFGTHPGAAFFDDSSRNFSPGYWVGNGILPDAVQSQNIHLSIYKVDGRKGFLERERLMLTHVFFPTKKFHQVKILERRAFGRINDSYVQLLGSNALSLRNDDEIIQHGALTAWVCEVTDAQAAGSFEDYIQKALKQDLFLNGKTLTYKDLSLTYRQDFTISGQKVDTEYPRFDTPYLSAARKPEHLDIAFQGHSLHLDFKALERTEIVTTEKSDLR